MPSPDGHPQQATPAARPGPARRSAGGRTNRSAATQFQVPTRQGLLPPPRLGGTSRASGICLQTRDPPRDCEHLSCIMRTLCQGVIEGVWMSIPLWRLRVLGVSGMGKAPPTVRHLSGAHQRVCRNCVDCSFSNRHEALAHPIPHSDVP